LYVETIGNHDNSVLFYKFWCW